MRKIIGSICTIVICFFVYQASDYLGTIGQTIVSESEYNQLQAGMTMDQVAEIVGGTGYQVSSEVSDYGMQEVYQFSSPFNIKQLNADDIYMYYINGVLESVEIDGGF